MDPKEKRKRVMTRSIKLGHCVCDPRKPCPCPLFKEKNVCQCAGERVPPDTDRQAVRLTEFVRSAGCASKIGQKDLHKVLAMLPAIEDPRLLVGTATADDAGVFQLTPDVTIVQTVDVFTPGVDDPRLFGRIAACNSLSDVYAMGGKPVTALSVIGFPIYSLPHEVMAEIICGGMEVLDEAGTILLGGHSINDEEIKFGFAVTGLVTDTNLVTNAGAQPGDALILTKPLGTGIVSLANQINRADPESLAAIEASMSSLNRAAAEIMVRHGATACTDVTGFGLLGHLCQLVRESGVCAEIEAGRLPLFPHVMEYAQQGMFSGANERNAEYSAEVTQFDDGIGDEVRAILYDAQTSGGLLIALPSDRADAALDEMHEAGLATATRIGSIVSGGEPAIHVKASAGAQGNATNIGSPGGFALPGKASSSLVGRGVSPSRELDAEHDANKEEAMTQEKKEEHCAHEAPAGGDPMKMFKEYLGDVTSPGAIDVVTKELIAVALGLAVHCEPCSRVHIKKALGMGIGADELEEAAALAIAFSGCRALMLWNEMKKELGV